MNDYVKREDLAQLAFSVDGPDEAIALLAEALSSPTAPPMINVSEVDGAELCGTYRTRQLRAATTPLDVIGLDLFVERIGRVAGRVHLFTIRTEHWNLVGVADDNFTSLIAATAVAT